MKINKLVLFSVFSCLSNVPEDLSNEEMQWYILAKLNVGGHLLDNSYPNTHAQLQGSDHKPWERNCWWLIYLKYTYIHTYIHTNKLVLFSVFSCLIHTYIYIYRHVLLLVDLFLEVDKLYLLVDSYMFFCDIICRHQSMSLFLLINFGFLQRIVHFHFHPHLITKGIIL